MRATSFTSVAVMLATVAVAGFILTQLDPQVTAAAPLPVNPQLADLKDEVVVDVESRRDFTQQMVDMIFSFNELGFQEFETQRYVTGILEEHNFTV